jgi:hypothetical protein
MFRAHQTTRAGDALDDAHPLAASLSDVRILRGQTLVGVGVLIACAARLATHGRWAPALTLAAALVAAVCGARLLAALQAHARLVLDLLADGRDAPPLREVVRVRDRLAGRARRGELADTLDAIAGAPDRGAALVNLRVAHEAAGELRATAGALRASAPGLRGVALVERLVGDGCSALYGTSADALCCELRRARYHLDAATPEARTSTSR